MVVAITALTIVICILMALAVVVFLIDSVKEVRRKKRIEKWGG